MKNKKGLQISILLAVIIIGAYTIGTSLFKETKIPLVGDKAPDFNLIALDGENHRLSEYQGKWVVVNFWGTFCPPCVREMPLIQKQYEKWQPTGKVEMLAVNLDEPLVTVQAFIEEHVSEHASNGAPVFPVLLDKDVVRKQYGVTSYPTTFFIDPKGVVRHIAIGEMELGKDPNRDIDALLTKFVGSQ
jgi:alkyl hydroperoxide reductase subunit AhpC